jgi:hypothetical protein
MDEQKKETERQRTNREKSILRTEVEAALSEALSTVPTDDAPSFLSVAQSIQYSAHVPKRGTPWVGAVSESYPRARTLMRPTFRPRRAGDPIQSEEDMRRNEVNAWIKGLVAAAVERKREIDQANRERAKVDEIADRIGADSESLSSFVRYNEPDQKDPEDVASWTLRAQHSYCWPSIRPEAVEQLCRALLAAGIVKSPAEIAAEKLAKEQRRKVESLCGAMYGMREGQPGRFSDSESRAALEAHGWDVKATLHDLLKPTTGLTDKAG